MIQLPEIFQAISVILGCVLVLLFMLIITNTEE